jgi:hypothetical protein
MRVYVLVSVCLCLCVSGCQFVCVRGVCVCVCVCVCFCEYPNGSTSFSCFFRYVRFPCCFSFCTVHNAEDMIKNEGKIEGERKRLRHTVERGSKERVSLERGTNHLRT